MQKNHFTMSRLQIKKNNIKATWKLLNKVIRGTSNTDKLPEMFIENGREIRDKKGIANGFNSFFYKCWTKFSKAN